ncbi:MAG: helix-turn-helix domain-containing protein [Firmicutes bacterium]|nr:helix-turn-helix domain-containing protein [Bacillota bacterium]
MKIYRIVDEYIQPCRLIGYLLYYEKTQGFSIELAEDLEAGEAPLLFASFLKKGVRSIDPAWSRRWVQQRIVPADRQNLGAVLKANRMKEYDEMKLLLLGEGRCAQDDCAIVEEKDKLLPDWMYRRMRGRLMRVIPLSGWSVLVSFSGEDMPAMHVEIQRILKKEQFDRLKQEETLFRAVRLQPGGQGICWGENFSIPAEKLRETGVPLPLKEKDLRMMSSEVLDTAAVCRQLNCSRQYVDRLVKEGRLTVLQDSGRSRMYDRSEVERLAW